MASTNGSLHTHRLSKALDKASVLAKSLHHSYIGTEHVLISFLADAANTPEHGINDMLKTMGLNSTELHDGLLKAFRERVTPSPLSSKEDSTKTLVVEVLDALLKKLKE